MTFNVAEFPIVVDMDDFYLTWMLYWMIFILAEFSNGLFLTYLNFL